MREVRIHLADPDFRVGECPMKFTLTYEGPLRMSKGQPKKKHEIRKQFHRQLKRLWAVDSFLSDWVVASDSSKRIIPTIVKPDSRGRFPRAR